MRCARSAACGSCVTMTMVFLNSLVEPLEQLQDLLARLAVEVAGGLVGEQHRWDRSTSARAIATRCSWPPESWRG